MNSDELIDYQWSESEKSARRIAMIRPNVDWIHLRNSIFEYHRKRTLNLEYSEVYGIGTRYCFRCLAYRPNYHFC